MSTSRDTTPTTSKTAYVLDVPALTDATMVADDIYTYNTPTLLNFAATTTASGRLFNRSAIAVALGSFLFVENATHNVTLVSGFANCKSTLEMNYAEKKFTIYLFDENNELQCSVENEAAFHFRISGGLATNPTEPGPITFTIETSVDDVPTAMTTGYYIEENRVENTTFLTNDLRTNHTPTLFTFQGATSSMGSMASGAYISVLANASIFKASFDVFSVALGVGFTDCLASGNTSSDGHAMTVVLRDSHVNKSCSVGNETNFSYSIQTGMKGNSATEIAVGYQMKTSADSSLSFFRFAYSLVTPKVSSASLTVNDKHIENTPTLMTVQGQTSGDGHLKQSSEIIVTANVPIFVVDETAIAANLVQGFAGCVGSGKVGPAGKTFTLQLQNGGGETCKVSNNADFKFTIASGLAENANSTVQVTFTVETSRDDERTGDLVAYSLVDHRLRNPSFDVNDYHVEDTPSKLTVRATTTGSGALRAGDKIVLTITESVFADGASVLLDQKIVNCSSNTTVHESGKVLWVELVNRNGSACLVQNSTSIAFDLMAPGIKPNGATPTNVSFTLETSPDNVPTKTKIAYALVVPTLNNANMFVNDFHTSDTASLMEFSGTATTSGRLGENDTIVVSAGSPIFVVNATPAVKFLGGLSGGNCKTSGVAKVGTEGKVFTLTLKNNNPGQNCILASSATFRFTISDGIAQNSATPGSVTFTMSTTHDDVSTASATAYGLAHPLVLSPVLAPNTVFAGETPSYFDFSFQTSISGALVQNDVILIVLKRPIFTQPVVQIDVTSIQKTTCKVTGRYITPAQPVTTTSAATTSALPATTSTSVLSTTTSAPPPTTTTASVANGSSNSTTSAANTVTSETSTTTSSASEATTTASETTTDALETTTGGGRRRRRLLSNSTTSVASSSTTETPTTTAAANSTAASTTETPSSTTTLAVSSNVTSATGTLITTTTPPITTTVATTTGTAMPDGYIAEITLLDNKGQACNIASGATFSIRFQGSVSANGAMGDVTFSVKTTPDYKFTNESTAYTILEPPLSNVGVDIDDYHTNDRASEMTFQAITTTSGALGDEDKITVSSLSQVFEIGQVPSVQLQSGFHNCTATSLINDFGRQLVVTLSDLNATHVCQVGNNSAFAFAIYSGIVVNINTPNLDVVFNMKTSEDTSQTNNFVGYTLVSPVLTGTKLLPNTNIVNLPASLMEFSGTATTSGRLGENDTIVVSAGSPIFVVNATPAVKFLGGLSGGNCKTSGVAKVGTEGKVFTLTLKNNNPGQNCILASSATFRFTISDGIAQNSATPGSVTFTMSTTHDDVSTANATAYRLVCYPSEYISSNNTCVMDDIAKASQCVDGDYFTAGTNGTTNDGACTVCSGDEHSTGGALCLADSKCSDKQDRAPGTDPSVDDPMCSFPDEVDVHAVEAKFSFSAGDNSTLTLTDMKSPKMRSSLATKLANLLEVSFGEITIVDIYICPNASDTRCTFTSRLRRSLLSATSETKFHVAFQVKSTDSTKTDKATSILQKSGASSQLGTLVADSIKEALDMTVAVAVDDLDIKRVQNQTGTKKKEDEGVRKTPSDCPKGDLEEDYVASKWLYFECEVEQSPIMFAFGVTSTVVLIGILVGSILGYNKKTTERLCCKICRCGGPKCEWCCVPKCKCPGKCVKCTCCYDEEHESKKKDDGSDGDVEMKSVTPGLVFQRGKSKFKSQTKVIPVKKKQKMEKRATAAQTREVSRSMFEFEDFLLEREELSDEEDNIARDNKIDEGYDNDVGEEEEEEESEEEEEESEEED